MYDFFIMLISHVIQSRKVALVNLRETSDFPTIGLIVWCNFITEPIARKSYNSGAFVVGYRRLSYNDRMRRLDVLGRTTLKQVWINSKVYDEVLCTIFRRATKYTPTIIAGNKFHFPVVHMK